MATNAIITSGDQVLFNPAFGPATVIVRPGIIQGTGKATINGNQVCVVGDEESASVSGCMYVSGLFTQSGFGTLKIVPFSASQLTGISTSNGDQIILKGTVFRAVFEVEQAAVQITPTGPVQDVAKEYPGTAQFVTGNFKFNAS
ncbi:MAG: hypothetical protein AAFQ94_00260 [Bacteroidota bacterium]